jgi:adenylate kinase family enzyme
VKIYIVGSVASGKSTLAKKISQITGVPCYHLDETVYVVDPTEPSGNKKRSIKERNILFRNMLEQTHYIMEDAGRECFCEGMKQADTIILLEIPLIIRKKRILLRWIKQNLGIEKCIYRPCFDMLNAMFHWARDYDTGEDGTKKRVSLFENKTIVLHNNKDIKQYMKTLRRIM